MVKKSFIVLAGFMLFVFPALLLISSILAPYFESIRMEAASLLYSFLSNFCHQKPSRSLWIFGSPMGIDSRSFALYASFLLTGLRLSTSQSRIHWKSGLLFLIPILIDGFTQLFGLRESTNVLRLLTGALGGIGLGLLVYPFYYKVLKGFSSSTRPVLLWPGMKHVLSLALVISLFALSLSPLSSSYAQAPKKRTVVLKEGTTLAFKAMDTVDSATAKRGQQVRFEVVRDVTVDDVVVIKAGAAAVGEVVHVASSKAIGRGGTRSEY